MWNSSRFFLQGHRLYAGTDTSGWFLGIFYQLQFSESKRPELQPGTSCARHRQLEAFIGQQESSVADGAPCELIHRYTPLKKCYQARKLGRLDSVMVLRLIICCSSAWQPTWKRLQHCIYTWCTQGKSSTQFNWRTRGSNDARGSPLHGRLRPEGNVSM